jgi:hypothetical protein
MHRKLAGDVQGRPVAGRKIGEDPGRLILFAGQVMSTKYLTLAGLVHSRPVEEAARWLRPKERNVVLQDRALIALLARLPRTAPVRGE